jgi:HK97 family phage portal protein
MLTRVIDFALKRAASYGGYSPSKEPPSWLLSNKFFSRAGVDVTPENARQLAAFYGGVQLYCSTFAALPLMVYKRRDDDGKERATKHWLYRLLHDRPNTFMTPSEFKEMMMGHLILRGNFYARKAFNQRGQVAELYPVHPDRVTPTWELIGGGVWGIVYTVSGLNSEGAGRFLADDILHIKGQGSDGVKGESIVQAQRETIGRGLAAGEHASDFFSNYAVPLGVLEYPEELGDDEYERIKTSWKERQGGSNRYSPAILEGGMKWQQLGVTNRDAQFLESRRFEVTEVARILNLPLCKLKDLERAIQNNIEQQQIEFVTDSLLPWATRIEEGLSLALLSEEERKGILVEFLMKGLLRGDTTARYNAYHLALQDGWMNRNEVRACENLNREDDLDTFLEPMNMIPAGTERIPAAAPTAAAPAPDPDQAQEDEEDPPAKPVAKPKDNPPAKGEKPKRSIEIDSMRGLFNEFTERALGKEAKALERYAKKPAAARLIEEFYAEHRKYLWETFSNAVDAIFPDGAGRSVLTDWADEVVADRQGELLRLLQAPDYLVRIDDYIKTLSMPSLFERQRELWINL